MRYFKCDIVFQEIPGEISLAFSICGCPLRCPGCHSPELWTEKSGQLLSGDLYCALLNRYKGLATNVLFLGGEWHPAELIEFLQIARSRGFRTSLYTGLESVSPELKAHLDYLKVGPWRSERGGLSSPHTNQILWNLRNGTKMNHLFINSTTSEGETTCL